MSSKLFRNSRQSINQAKAAIRRMNAIYGKRQVRKAMRAARRHELPDLVPKDSGQHPKLQKPRKHHRVMHPQRDELGAYTLVGRTRVRLLGGDTVPARRKWVGGVSARIPSEG